jgi:hypothetical protein
MGETVGFRRLGASKKLAKIAIASATPTALKLAAIYRRDD